MSLRVLLTSCFIFVVTLLHSGIGLADEGGMYRCTIPNYSRDIQTFVMDFMIKDGEWYVSPPNRFEWTSKKCGTTVQKGAYTIQTKCKFDSKMFSNDVQIGSKSNMIEEMKMETIYLHDLKYVYNSYEAPDFKGTKQVGSCEKID